MIGGPRILINFARFASVLSENHKFQPNNQLRLKQYDLPKKEAPRDLLDAGGYSHELCRVGS